MLIAFCGRAGSGKDAASDFLVKNDLFVKVALADPMKRIVREVYDFTDIQLWGPSAARNAPDKRYPRGEPTVIAHEERCSVCLAVHISPTPGSLLEKVGDCLDGKTCPDGGFHAVRQANIVGQKYLTPRFALQQLGTEWARHCYENTWVDLALRTYERLQAGDCYYDVKTGLRPCSSVAFYPAVVPKKDVAISDVQSLNEVEAINAAGGKVYKLLRGDGLEGAAGQPASEQAGSIPEELFAGIIDNREWALDQLESHLHGLLEK